MQEKKWAKPVPSHRDQTNKSGLRAAGSGRREVHRRPGHQSQRHLMRGAHKCATVPVWAAAEVGQGRVSEPLWWLLPQLHPSRTSTAAESSAVSTCLVRL